MRAFYYMPGIPKGDQRGRLGSTPWLKNKEFELFLYEGRIFTDAAAFNAAAAKVYQSIEHAGFVMAPRPFIVPEAAPVESPEGGLRIADLSQEARAAIAHLYFEGHKEEFLLPPVATNQPQDGVVVTSEIHNLEIPGSSPGPATTSPAEASAGSAGTPAGVESPPHDGIFAKAIGEGANMKFVLWRRKAGAADLYRGIKTVWGNNAEVPDPFPDMVSAQVALGKINLPARVPALPAKKAAKKAAAKPASKAPARVPALPVEAPPNPELGNPPPPP